MTAERLLDLFGGPDPQPAATPWVHAGFLLAALALCVSISVIDLRRRIIPDPMNALLAGLGLALASFGGPDAAVAAALQGLLCFGLFAAFRRLYRAVRGMQGLGFGDVKFLGAAAIWVGLGGVAPLVLVASLAALVYVTIARLRGARITGRSALPFGPFLALGLAVVLGGALAFPSSI